MNRRLARAFFAATTAGAAALAALGMAGASSASVKDQPAWPRVPVQYTSSTAGYVTGGAYRFRFVSAELRVPARQTEEGNNTGAVIKLTTGTTFLASVMVMPGGGPGSVTYADSYGTGTLSLSPQAGQTLRVSIYRDRQASRDVYTVTNLWTGRTRIVAVHTPARVVFRHAEISSTIANQNVSTPPQDTRLWAFRSVKVTSYSGVHGSMFGPWVTTRLIDTKDGTATGTVVMYPTNLHHAGQNFGIWLKGEPPAVR